MKNLTQDTKLNITDKYLNAKIDTLTTFLKYDLFKKIPADTKNINIDSNQEFFDIVELEIILNDINKKNKAFIEESNQKEKQKIIDKKRQFAEKEVQNIKNLLSQNPEEIELIKKIEDKEKYIANISEQDIKIRKNKLLTDLLFLQIDKNDKKILNQFNLSVKLPDEMLNDNKIIKEIKSQIEKNETIAIAKEFNNFCKENNNISEYIILTKNINKLHNDIQKIDFEINELSNDYITLNKEELENLSIDRESKEKQLITYTEQQTKIENNYKQLQQKEFNNILISDFYLLDKYLNILEHVEVDSVFMQNNLKNEDVAKVINAIQEARGHSEDYLHYAVEKYQNKIMQDLVNKITENNINVQKEGTENILILNAFSTNDACNRCSYKMNDILDIFTSQLQKIEELNNVKTKLIYNSSKKMLYKSTKEDNKLYSHKSEGFSTSNSKSYHITTNVINHENLDDIKKMIDFDDFETKSFSSQNLKSETKYNANKILVDDKHSCTTEKPSNQCNGKKYAKLKYTSMFKEQN